MVKVLIAFYKSLNQLVTYLSLFTGRCPMEITGKHDKFLLSEATQ